MGSKVVGFRLQDDLAEALGKLSAANGMTTTDFLRKMVDDKLYPPTVKAELKETNADEQIAKLAEQAKLLEEKDSELETTQAKVVELEAQLAEVPQSIADFPDEVLTEYLNNAVTAAWQDADPEKKAKLAEQWGMELTVPKPPPAPADAPLAEDAPAEETVKPEEPKGIKLTLGGKTIGYLSPLRG